MAIGALQAVDIIEVMENFIERRRPPEILRTKVDLNYKIEGQSVIIFETRPQWDNPQNLLEHPVAKTTFVKEKAHWKVFWMRADLKWHPYAATPTVKRLEEFTKLVEEDRHHCFWG